MKAEHVTLIKKAIRMVDYMRADLVRILEAEGAATTLLQPLDKMGDKPASGLYAAFDAAKSPPAPITPEQMAAHKKLLSLGQSLFSRFRQTRASEAIAYVRTGDGQVFPHCEFIGIGATDDEAIADWMNKVRAHLDGFVPSVIFWRIMPEIEHCRDFQSGAMLWKVYGRFAVIPEEVAKDEGSQGFIPFRDKALPDPAPLYMPAEVQAFDDSIQATAEGLQVVEPEEFAPPPPPPAPSEPNEYEQRKAEIHAQQHKPKS